MKTVYWNPRTKWFLPERDIPTDTVSIEVPEDAYRMIDRWGDTAVSEDPMFSGVLADWIEDNLELTLELEEFVVTLRYIFANRTWVRV